jgi:hypothetical protein
MPVPPAGDVKGVGPPVSSALRDTLVELRRRVLRDAAALSAGHHPVKARTLPAI